MKELGTSWYQYTSISVKCDSSITLHLTFWWDLLHEHFVRLCVCECVCKFVYFQRGNRSTQSKWHFQCKNKKRYSLFCSLTVLTEILTTFFNNSSFLFYHLFNHLPVLRNLEVPKVGVALPNRDTVASLEGRGWNEWIQLNAAYCPNFWFGGRWCKINVWLF